MKTILTITVVTLAAIALFSCQDDTLDPEKPDGTVVFNVDPVGLTFGVADKDAQSIYVTTLNVEWKAEVEDSAQEWLKITQESQKIIVRVEENKTEEARTGKIVIKTDNEALNPNEIIVTQSFMETLRIPMTAGYAMFFGNNPISGLGSYYIELAGGDAKYSEYMGIKFFHQTEGYQIFLWLEAEEAVLEDYRRAELKPHTYRAGTKPTEGQEEFEAWTFIRSYKLQKSLQYLNYEGSLLVELEDEDHYSEIIELTEGQVIIEETDDDYSVRGEFVSDNGQRIVIDYPGPFNYIGRYDGLHYSRIDEDISLDPDVLIDGIIYFLGERVGIGWDFWGPDTPGYYCWFIHVWSSHEEKDGDEMWLTVFSPMTDSLVLDDGEYIMVPNESVTGFTSEAGWLFDIVELPRGCWYNIWINHRKLHYQVLLGLGTVTVKHNGGNNYTIAVDAYMDSYYKFDASFEGDLEYIDWSHKY